jgi:conjugal transfer pilus assembly protein TrbC
MWQLLTIVFLCTKVFGWEHDVWLKQSENRTDEEAISWLRKQINPEEKRKDLPLLASEPCTSCLKGTIIENEEPKLLVFISFTVPDNIWLSLSQEMIDEGGVFVVRGLPDNSFKSFAGKIAKLKEKGMEASVQIHPDLFKVHAIDRVPSFVFLEGKLAHKVCGAISLEYAQSLIKDSAEYRRSISSAIIPS